ncbi:hypothetical protein B0J17DRAFT_116357 [Rhizoctonia solani]|nr:hypothetical protein B0J17DRAFT_116357 [Rhizoctonia solani]
MCAVTRTPLISTLDLPSEVLVRILHYCDYNSIIRFSLTCKSSHEVVRHCISLQLHIELEINGLEVAYQSSTVDSYSSILRDVEGYGDAWLNFRLTPGVQQHIIHPSIRDPRWILRNGIYIRGFRESNVDYTGDNRIDRIQLTDLYSRVVPAPLDFKQKFHDFVVDVSQDLVVLFTNSKARSLSHVHMYQITTGMPHPLARLPVFTVRFDDSWGSIGTELMVLGSILVIISSGPESIPNRCNALIWDWQSCHLLGGIHVETRDDLILAFLDKNHLYAYSTLPNSATELQDPNQLALLIFRIPSSTANNIHQEPQSVDFHVPSYPRIAPILILELPKLHNAYELDGYISESEPFVGDLAYRGSSKIVHSRTTTIVLNIWLKRRARPATAQDPADIDYCVFVNTDPIFDYLMGCRTQETVRITWSQWGTAATRWFTDKDTLLVRSGAAYGSRYALWDTDRQATGQLFFLFEFNPHVIRRRIHTSEAGVVVKGREPLSGHAFDLNHLKNSLKSLNSNQEIITEIIGRDTKTVIEKGFENSVESCLPYMLIIRQNMPRHEGWYLQGSCLVGCPVAGNLGQNPILSVFNLEHSSSNP